MAGAEKTLDKVKKNTKGFVTKPWTTLDAGAVIKKGAADATSLFTPEIPELPEETIIPIPDESTAALEARKRRAKAASTRSGRDSTILTEGLGG